jgi:hypothetical protein
MDLQLFKTLKAGESIDMGAVFPFDDEAIRWTVTEAGEGTLKDNNGTHAIKWCHVTLTWHGVYLGNLIATEDPSTKSGIRYEARRKDGDTE